MSDTAPLPLALDEPDIAGALQSFLAALERSSTELARIDAAIETYRQDARRLAESLGSPTGRE